MQQQIELTLSGYRTAETLLGVRSLFEAADPWAYFILNALRAKELLIRDRQYVLQPVTTPAGNQQMTVSHS